MAEKGRLNAESVFEALGPIGRYQKILIFVAVLGELPACYQLLDNVFIGAQVSYRCSAPENETVLFDHIYDDHNKTVNYVNRYKVDYDQCDIKVLANDTVVKTTSCEYGYNYTLPKDSSVLSEFDLVCGKESLYSLTQTLVFVGQGIGAVVGTSISDRFGRKWVMIGSNIGMGVVGMVIAFSPSYIVFAVSKLLAGVFQQGYYITKAVYLVELLPTNWRNLTAMLFGMSWTFSAVSMVLISYLMRDSSWTMLQFVFSLSSLFAILQIAVLDESIRWLIANNKTKEALRCIKKAARWNKRSYGDVVKASFSEDVCLEEQDKDVNDGSSVESGEQQKLSLLDVLRVKRLLLNAVVMWCAWFASSFGYFTLFLTGSTLHGDKYVNYILLTLMEIPAELIFFFGYNRIGRKPVNMLLFTILGTGLLAIGLFRYLSESEDDIFAILTLIASLYAIVGAMGSFYSIFIYTSEIFPTNVRNQASGVASFIARIGAMLAPFTGDLMTVAVWLPGLIIGTCALFVAVGLIAVPETRDKELPQTLEDLKGWYKTDNKDDYLAVRSSSEETEDNEAVPTKDTTNSVSLFNGNY